MKKRIIATAAFAAFASSSVLASYEIAPAEISVSTNFDNTLIYAESNTRADYIELGLSHVFDIGGNFSLIPHLASVARDGGDNSFRLQLGLTYDFNEATKLVAEYRYTWGMDNYYTPNYQIDNGLPATPPTEGNGIDNPIHFPIDDITPPQNYHSGQSEISRVSLGFDQRLDMFLVKYRFRHYEQYGDVYSFETGMARDTWQEHELQLDLSTSSSWTPFVRIVATSDNGYGVEDKYTLLGINYHF
ncbi:hypothetical protein [Shewanella sp.]|uniref:hypothetical protein n=1 Tax=Shewanella sp. TaxID=50422 RepID=UPI001EC9751E|nr:hypothetical protein [Shewanella sp.]NRB24292.1 hypothetical protein [Shewanella sp.]